MFYKFHADNFFKKIYFILVLHSSVSEATSYSKYPENWLVSSVKHIFLLDKNLHRVRALGKDLKNSFWQIFDMSYPLFLA